MREWAVLLMGKDAGQGGHAEGREDARRCTEGEGEGVMRRGEEAVGVTRGRTHRPPKERRRREEEGSRDGARGTEHAGGTRLPLTHG